MAGPKGKKYAVGPPVTEFLKRTAAQKKYFYIDGLLYRTIVANRAADIIRAWDYENKRVVAFVWSDAKRTMQQAFDTAEVAKLLNRSKKSVLDYVTAGAINAPTKIGEQANGFGHYKWSEDDVLALHGHYLTVGAGRPRKDGIINSAVRLPSRMELVAMMKQNRMMYIQDADGNFVPIFDNPDWT